jgi:flavodoxin
MKETRILVAFYPRKGNNYLNGNIVELPIGNTEVAATMIQQLTNGDTFKIDTVQAYPAGYTRATVVAQEERDRKARPELVADLDNLDAYDLIVLSYPNWWGTAPIAVFTFLESHDFSGKTILPLCTHEGSGLGHSESDIKASCPGAKVLKGLAIMGGSVRKAQEPIAAWLRQAAVMA